MHPFDRRLLVAGAVALILAVAGVIRAPRESDGERAWHRRITRVAAAGWLLAHGLAVLDLLLDWRGARAASGTLGRRDELIIAESVLVNSMIGWVFLLACGAAALAVAFSVRRRAVLATCVVVLLAASFTPALAPPSFPQGFMPFRSRPASMELMTRGILLLLLPACLLCIVGVVRVIRGSGDRESHHRARRFCLLAGFFATSLGALFFLFMTLGTLQVRLIQGPGTPISRFDWLPQVVLGNPWGLLLLACGVGAAGLVGFGFARGEGDEPVAGGRESAP